MTERGRARVELALIAAAWGSVAVIVRAVSLPAAAITFYRVSIAAAAIAFGVLATGGVRSLIPRAGRRWLVLLGSVLAVHWLLYFEAIKLSSVPLAVLLVYTGPMFIALLAPVLTGERPSRVTWPALAAGSVGVAVVATDHSHALHASGQALAAGLGAGFSFALLMITARRVARDVGPPVFVFWETAVASLLLAPLAFAGRVLPPNASCVVGVLALGVGATAVLGLLFARVMRHVDAPSAGVLMFVEPVSSVLLAWLFLSERPSARTIVGGLMVLSAGLAVVRDDVVAVTAGGVESVRLGGQ